MRHIIASLCCYVQASHSMQVRGSFSEGNRLPSLSVAILSKRTDTHRRANVRQMWRDGVDSWRKRGWGTLRYTFVLANPPANEKAFYTLGVRNEQKKWGDVVIEDVDEGYENGTLTAKVLASMKRYIKSGSPPDLFMKIDDDTFVEFSRLRGILRSYMLNGGNITQAFMGVFPRSNQSHAYHRGTPCRDPDSMWYESESSFPNATYPVAPQGGPGYILSRDMVKRIVWDGIARDNLLSMEDKAVGVWVSQLVQRGFNVDYVDIPGTNGYAVQASWMKGPMYQYPFVLHHHLDGKTIACLNHIASKKDNLFQTVDKCNFGTTKFLDGGNLCNDGRQLLERRESVIEGWSSMRWQIDDYGDQVPVKGSTRNFGPMTTPLTSIRA